MFQSILKKLRSQGPDPEIGLISKITDALEGNIETLETLNDEERNILLEQIDLIKQLKEDNPELIDSKGIPGNYWLEAKYDRTNWFGIFGNNWEEPDENFSQHNGDFYVHPPNQYFQEERNLMPW